MASYSVPKKRKLPPNLDPASGMGPKPLPAPVRAGPAKRPEPRPSAGKKALHDDTPAGGRPATGRDAAKNPVVQAAQRYMKRKRPNA